MTVYPVAENAFSKPTGPSLFGARDKAYALVKLQNPLRDNKGSRFCTQIPSQRAQDRTNAIKAGK